MTIYAASNPATTFNWAQIVGQNGFDLEQFIQQIQHNLAQGGAGSGSVTAPGAAAGANQAGSAAGAGADSKPSADADSNTGAGKPGTTAGSSAGSSAAGSQAGTGSKAGAGSAAGSSQAGTNSGSKAGASTPSNSGSAAGSSDASGSTAAQSDFAAEVVSLVNQERAKAGLNPLKSDAKLTSVAAAKAKDMYANNYFDHNSPTYGSPFDMMQQFGVSYSYAGENIAKGQQNPQAVMDAWMNSSGHRANILNANFKSIGVAYYNGEWVQEFTG
ncbi:hypothetical protein H4Q31_20950 [Cohnella lubricantis]|uniref:SCP domain-containing protein n=2 Tax=Cohnella lubricantis TaxID=2163172 RepID=A0A841THY5_9BACL|nr:hypothetical protein [Cohnella lubricantis]